MDKIFITILNMSLTGAFIVAVIMLVRLPLKRLPKNISYCLWIVPGFRFVYPLSMGWAVSLIPFKAAPIPQDIATQAVPRIDSGITVIDNTISSLLPSATPQYSVNPLQVWTFIGAYIWLAGLIIMLAYGITSYFLLKYKMRNITTGEDNVYKADNIQSPFLLGVIKPKIYIPLELSVQERNYVVLHEGIHIKRYDYIIKFIAYFILCLHWFNPFAWAAFILMSADMEMSCDERALKEMGGAIKRDYSLSLLSLAGEKRVIGGNPLAFGEGGIKERIKNILKIKNRSRILLFTVIVLAAVLSVGFVNNKNSGTAGIVLGLNQYQNIANKAALSIVGIKTVYNTPQFSSTGYNSGIIFSEDKVNVYIVTTIPPDNDEILVNPNGNTEIPAYIAKYDPESWLAVLYITKADLSAIHFKYEIAAFGDSSKVQIGDNVLAVNSTAYLSKPDNMPEAIISEDHQVIAKHGFINEINKQIEFDGRSMNVIETDIDVPAGSAGGALLNSSNEIVGILMYKYDPKFTENSDSINGKIVSYSIPINIVSQSPTAYRSGGLKSLID